MLKLNRRILLRGLIAAPLVVGGGLLAVITLPRMVQERVEQRVQSRLGLPARVSGVSLGFTEVAIAEIAVGEQGHGPSVRVRELVLDASPLLLGLRGEKALDAVRVAQLDAKLPLQEASSQQLLERVRPGSAAKPGATGETKPAESSEGFRGEVAIERLSLAVDRSEGALARVEGHGRVRGGEIAFDFDRVALGSAPGHAIELARVVVRAKRGPEGVQLEQLNVGQGRVLLAEAEPQAEDAAGPDDEAEAPEASDAAAAQAPAPEVEAPAGPSWGERARALLDRLAPNAVLSLNDTAVYTRGPKEAPILEALRATVKMQQGRTLTLAGSGKASAGGAISWDLQLKPEELEADGEVALRSLPLPLIAPFLPSVPWYEPELGRVDAQLSVKTEAGQAIALAGEASLRDAAISAARIAATPVQGIGISVRGKGRFLPLANRLEIAEAALTTPSDATLQLSGAVEWSRDHYLFDIDAVLPKTPCTNAVRAIPEDLLAEMSLASWQGKLGGKLRVRLDSRALDKTELDLDLDEHCEFVTVPAMADLRRFHQPFLHSVLEPNDKLFEMETGPGTENWTYIEDISPFFVHAVLAHEDAGFFNHRGFSMLHVRNALVRNLKERRYVVGASTITMQLVKNVFLHREKTLARKIQEVLLTWWIERVMDKRDILELYLNVIEYGPGVYGIRNGARHYFNRLPDQLSPAESVYLSTILPNPKRYHSHFERGALSPQWAEQMRRMLVRLRERGSYSPEAAEYGLSELQNFRFVPEGTPVPPRMIPGEAAPLPYMRGFDADAPGWDDEPTGQRPFAPLDQRLPARTGG